MREGFWINYATGLEVEINEHESWIRGPGNAGRLGVPAKATARFGEFVPVVDRERFLTFVMSHAPVMRVRGHGVHITFEFAVAGDVTMVIQSIVRFCEKNAGARSWIRIGNLATNKTIVISWIDFIEKHRKRKIT